MKKGRSYQVLLYFCHVNIYFKWPKSSKKKTDGNFNNVYNARSVVDAA